MTDELIICDIPNEEIVRSMQIGTTVEFGCTFDLAKLTSENKYDHPTNENIFYDLFLVDYNGDLIDVPVLI
eukprot:CAMPEP_0116870894 /NCGR_PEP_ID=MMETSP0463-20121206/1010_1 /TAXON_ID=181622 /ORGANISM="Strombidinopsis sp, Strain SopsisLIS2011" /LENGTH=70 /DNA_ID=CAMNT_0004508303 /DNA_START=1008 /DNA_END=1220 /DNA_ORIENTATION=-